MTTSGLILIRRKQIIVVFFILFIISAAKVFLFPVYEAESTIMIDLKQRPTSIDSESVDASQMVSLVRTHSDLIQSQPVLKIVVDKLKLYEDLANDKNNIPDSLKEKLSRSAIDLLRRKYLTIVSPAFTSLIQVKVKYKDPEKAAEIANTLVNSYIKWSVGFLHNETKTLIAYLNAEIEVAKQKLQNSEDELEKFRNEYKVISLPEEVRAQIQLIPEEIKTHLKLVEAIDIKLFELEVELSRMRELYTDESPQIVFMKERIAKFRKQLDEENSKSKFGENYFENLNNVPEKEMLLDRLQRKVKIDEDLYLLLLKEQERLKLLDAKETTENIRIVSSAVTPLKPSGRVTGLLAGMLVSFLSSLALAFILELKKTRKL